MTEAAVQNIPKRVERIKAADLKRGDTLQVRFMGDDEYTTVDVVEVVPDDHVIIHDEHGMLWGLSVVNGLLGSHVKR